MSNVLSTLHVLPTDAGTAPLVPDSCTWMFLPGGDLLIKLMSVALREWKLETLAAAVQKFLVPAGCTDACSFKRYAHRRLWTAVSHRDCAV